ncbi:hypothetical protein BUE76_14425 [Cnuella takakiae]|nr:hypothetical protein BUE76_14425 [Cnuella takakiae]
MYEHKTDPILPAPLYYKRVAWNFAVAMGILMNCIIIGVLGYHYLAGSSWIDAFHNSSMLLSGMGPVITIESYSGKIFSSLYALFSGIVFVTTMGFILAPSIHRFFHKLHLEEDNK